MLNLGMTESFSCYTELIKKGKLTEKIYKNLENTAYNHSLENSSKIDSKKMIVLVYPFKFFELNPDIKKRKAPEINRYFSNVEKILTKRLPKYSVVLLEDSISYASYSSKLVEGKVEDGGFHLFNNIILTNKGETKPINNALYLFYNKEVFIGGCYNGSHVSKAISSIKKRSKKVYSIKDLVLESQENTPINLLSKKVYDSKCNGIKSISIKKFVVKEKEDSTNQLT